MCARAKKIREIFLAVRHTLRDLLLYLVTLKLGINLTIIIIDLIILIWNLFRSFSLQGKSFSRKYLYLCWLLFELIVFVIILFGTQHIRFSSNSFYPCSLQIIPYSSWQGALREKAFHHGGRGASKEAAISFTCWSKVEILH